MTTKVAINGFGRIGRLVFRALIESGRKDIQIVAINDLAPPAANVHLLQYDSVHGMLKEEVKLDGEYLVCGSQKAKIVQEKDPNQLPWAELGVDIVLECTGIFTDKEKAEVHLKAGAKRVVVSAPSKGADFTVVYGVNHTGLKAEHMVISNASCTTNCLAPVVYVLDKEFGVDHGFMTTVHSFTGDQRTVDTNHSDMYRARCAFMNMIPTSTGAARAVGEVLPQMKGKLDGVAIRVPTADVSLVDLKCVLKKEVSADEVNAVMKKYADGELKGILGYNDKPLVSTDFLHCQNSSTFDAGSTKVINGNFLRIMSWYDNEWGFSNRMLDTVAYFGSLIK